MLVDDEFLFLGSPNLTGAGMKLTPASNKEIGIKTKALDKDLHTINQLVEDATEINDEIIEELKKWLKKVPKIEKPKIPDFPEIVKENFKENFNKLWVHNFPWAKAEDLINLKNINENIEHDLDLFGLNKDSLNNQLIKKNLMSSKIYYWLINQIKKQENEEIYFGNLSSIIHNSLLDDPKPYRKDIKELQANLYTYIKSFLSDKISIDVPYEKSERLKLIN